jgi:hypothetical protein
MKIDEALILIVLLVLFSYYTNTRTLDNNLSKNTYKINRVEEDDGSMTCKELGLSAGFGKIVDEIDREIEKLYN